MSILSFTTMGSPALILTLPTRVALAFASDGRMQTLPIPFPVSSFDVNLRRHEHTEDSAAQQWLCDTIMRTLSRVCSRHGVRFNRPSSHSSPVPGLPRSRVRPRTFRKATVRVRD